MAVANAYLSFKGNCEEAFNFYKSVFGGDFAALMRWKEMPPESPVPDQYKELVMHMSLPLSKGSMIAGADTVDGMGPPLVVGNNISIAVSPESEEEARRVFDGLAAGGQITMPLEKAFWGALFGMCTDKFGIHWMVNYEFPKV